MVLRAAASRRVVHCGGKRVPRRAVCIDVPAPRSDAVGGQLVLRREFHRVDKAQERHVKEPEVMDEGVAEHIVGLQVLQRVGKHLRVGEGLRPQLRHDLMRRLPHQPLRNEVVRRQAAAHFHGERFLCQRDIPDRLRQRIEPLFHKIRKTDENAVGPLGEGPADRFLLVLRQVRVRQQRCGGFPAPQGVHGRLNTVAAAVARLVVAVHAGADRHEPVVHAVQRHVQPQNVHHRAHVFNKRFIAGVGDKVRHGGQILRQIVVAEVFRKPVGEALADPCPDTHLRLFFVFPPCHTVVGKDFAFPFLPRQILADGEQDLVVLRPVAHAVVAGLVHKVFEMQERVADQVLTPAAQGIGAVLVYFEQQLRPEVGAVEAMGEVIRLRGQHPEDLFLRKGDVSSAGQEQIEVLELPSVRVRGIIVVILFLRQLLRRFF